jgi:hypothetical protein
MTDPQLIASCFAAGLIMGAAVRALAIGLLVLRSKG